jgi:hypothetical protein
MKRITRLGVAAVILFALIQLVPYGRDHENPPVIAEPAWDSPQTRELFFRACKDCHSYETHWPWYASIAPISWMMQYDIEEGRSHFNVSRWGQGKQDADEAAGMLRKGEMPPWFYLPAHPEAQLTDAEKQALIAGLVATFGDEQE